MNKKEQTIKMTFRTSEDTFTANLETLIKRTEHFLENYLSHALLGKTFTEITGEGSGGEKLNRLINACGFTEDAEGFFYALLKLLENSDSEEIKLNGIAMPHLYLVDLLAYLRPGNGYVSIKDTDQLQKVTNIRVPDDKARELQEVIDTYPVRLSWHTIRQMMVSGPVAYQYLPFTEELDPVGHTNTWVGQFHQGLLEQMYQNRVIFLLNMSCPVYCRFCFRKHKDSRNEANPTPGDVKKAIEHVAKSPSIKEIVVTGGDPFMNRKNMETTIDGLMEIDHVQTLRLATRSVAYFPYLFLRNEKEYLKYLKQKNLELQRHGKRMEIATHFIHPDEVSPESLDLISDFVKSGITVYIQTPFLQHCNDNGPALKKLFGLLRGAGAEMHYIYIPCSPIHGNSMYWSPLSDGIDIAEYLRAHLSDRSVPKICTATPIGKMEWYTSGWAVEPVKGKENFIWLRTPYTPEYFKSFAPLADDLPHIRVNEEGTLDIQFMARIGKEQYFLGSRPLRISRTEVPLKIPKNLKITNAESLLQSRAVIHTKEKHLRRVHETRVEISSNAGKKELDYISENSLISDVIITTGNGVPEGLYKIGKLIEKLIPMDHINAVRLRCTEFHSQPESYTDTVVRTLGEMNQLSVRNPLRLEIESWFIKPEEITETHKKVTRRLNNYGISVYCNTPLLGGINDFPDVIQNLTYAYRKAGIEFHHLYIAGLPIQTEWNKKHPVDMYDIIDIASKIRREGSGREGPRYIIQSSLGEAYYGLTSSFNHTEEGIEVTLDSYTLAYYREMDPDFTIPGDVILNEEGKPVLKVSGLISTTGFAL